MPSVTLIETANANGFGEFGELNFEHHTRGCTAYIFCLAILPKFTPLASKLRNFAGHQSGRGESFYTAVDNRSPTWSIPTHTALSCSTPVGDLRPNEFRSTVSSLNERRQ